MCVCKSSPIFLWFIDEFGLEEEEDIMDDMEIALAERSGEFDCQVLLVCFN